jgi:hypothetical protein
LLTEDRIVTFLAEQPIVSVTAIDNVVSGAGKTMSFPAPAKMASLLSPATM